MQTTDILTGTRLLHGAVVIASRAGVEIESATAHEGLGLSFSIVGSPFALAEVLGVTVIKSRIDGQIRLPRMMLTCTWRDVEVTIHGDHTAPVVVD